MLEIDKFRDFVDDGTRYGENQDFLTEFAVNSLTSLYPSSIIKRIIYRPMIGKWFPYIDIMNQEYNSQMAFFFDELSLCLSKERYCSLCGIEIQDFLNIIDSIPISVCPMCFNQIYYDYWKCLDMSHQSCANKNINSTSTQEISICDDFLDSRCGYLSNSEFTNTCLKDHAIGLVLLDANHIRIIIGRRDTLKYRMIWMGGLLGIILGFTNRIMNLSILNRVLSKFYTLLYEQTEYYNNFNQKLQIQLIHNSNQLPDDIEQEIWYSWLLYSLLNYYSNYEIKYFLKTKYFGAIEYLKLNLQNVITKCELDIIDYVELAHVYPPIDFTLRTQLEKVFFQGNLTRSKLNASILEFIKCSGSNISSLRNLFQDQIYSIKRITSEIEIKKILCVIGQFILVISNINEKPLLLNLKEIIGRKFF